MDFFLCIGNAIALVTVHQMKLERHRTVFFVFIAGLAFADLVGIFLTTFPVLLVYFHGYYFGGVRDSTNLFFLNIIIVTLGTYLTLRHSGTEVPTEALWYAILMAKASYRLNLNIESIYIPMESFRWKSISLPSRLACKIKEG